MSDAKFDKIRAKVEARQRLSAADGEFLFQDDVEVHAVGQLANLVRQQHNGNRAYYNFNAHLNPTNVCVYRCPLCAYSRDRDDPRAYVMSDEQILACGQEAAAAGCTELHVVGGAHPEKDFSWYVGIIRRLHAAFPHLHLKAFTAVEIDWFSHLANRPASSILEELIDAGLGSLPGGGAEIFAPEVRARLCPRKADGGTWLAIHQAAHQLGLRSNATMLFGHLETPQQRVDHLVQLRQLQDVTGGFQAFVPLAFHPQQTALGDLPEPSSLLALRVIAVSRLMLDNFDHVKAYWVSLGVGTAQTALAYGADDLDGTVRRERIYHDAGAQSPEVLAIDQLRRLIVEAGREPVERDTLYRCVRRHGVQWEVDSG